MRPNIDGFRVRILTPRSVEVEPGYWHPVKDPEAIVEQREPLVLDLDRLGLGGVDVPSLAKRCAFKIFSVGTADGKAAVVASITKDKPELPEGFSRARVICFLLTNDAGEIVVNDLPGYGEWHTY